MTVNGELGGRSVRAVTDAGDARRDRPEGTEPFGHERAAGDTHSGGCVRGWSPPRDRPTRPPTAAGRASRGESRQVPGARIGSGAVGSGVAAGSPRPGNSRATVRRVRRSLDAPGMRRTVRGGGVPPQASASASASPCVNSAVSYGHRRGPWRIRHSHAIS
ncbi:hypothetical protein GCM10010254_30290 [Streptomyces chromofuscus]|nr:hypothetical protein GCM10010254_30290 [Streptomyces chromofuscus]